MKLKQVSALLLALALPLSLAACGQTGGTAEKSPLAEEAAAPTPVQRAEGYQAEVVEEGYTLLAEIVDYVDSMADGDPRKTSGNEFDRAYSVNLASEEFSGFFKDSDGKAGLAEIIRNGEVYVNGYQIPYVREDGSYSATEFSINGSPNLWQIDPENDLWGWQLHMYYQYEGGPMENLSGIEGFQSGAPVPFETAATYYVEYLSNIRGQALRLYAKDGEDFASRIETTRLNTAIIGGQTDNGDGTVTLLGTGGNEIQTFPAENVDPALRAGDGVIFYEENGSGWVAQRAYEFTGPLVENPEDDHSPWILVDGETMSTADTLADKEMAEAYRHTQFIRGYRRTRQYDNQTVVSMWCTTPVGYGFGFTYPENSARDALEFAVRYTGDYADTLNTSTDGTDVSPEEFWVLPEDMDTFRAVLAEAEALLDGAGDGGSAAETFAYNEMILNLADAFGGKEGNFGPGANNTAGIFGSAQPGTGKS